jgi:Rrf2 family protein
VIRISKKVDYGIIILTHLALNPEAACSAREIARRYGVSYALVANLLKALATAGWVASARGMRGGYRIKRPPGEITLDELIEAIEGPYRFADCAGGPGEPICSVQTCPACDVVRRVHQEIRKTLKGVSIADLAGIGREKGFRV